MSYNKFKSTEFKDVNSLGYAIKSIGDVICNGTSNINGNMNVTGLTNSNGITNIGNIKNSNHLLMKADGTQSIYFTIDGNMVSTNNCVGRLFAGSNQMYFDYYNNFLFRDSTLADSGNNNALNISLSNSTFYGPLTTNNVTNNGTLSVSGTSSLGTLNVSGTSTLTGVLYTYNGITNSNAAIINNSTLTQVGTSVFADVVRVSPGKSLYISDNTFTNYLRMHHSGAAGYFDCTGGLNFRNGSTDNFNINGTTNQGTFGYNLNTNGITNNTNALINNAVLTQNSTANINSNLNVTGVTNLTSLELGPNGSNFTYIDMKATGGNGDYDCRIGVNSPSSGINPGQGALTINCGSCSLNSNLTTTGNISCNIINAATYNVGSTSYTGPIYMANASPIYLKSSTDLNHYIKYDSVYDGPQLGFYTGLSFKCTNNNAIILNTSKTDMNINVNTKINGNLNVSGGMNNSLYYSVKGSTYNNSTATTTYYYIKYDGSSGSSASETFQMQSYAICAKITYSYYSDFPSNVYQGTSEYVVYGANFSAVSMAWSVGSLQYQPVITCSSSGLITVQFAKNTALTGHITWSVGVLII